MAIIELFVLALALTILIECSIALVWLKSSRAVWAVCLCNVLTNPALNAILFCVSYYLTSSLVIFYSVEIFLEIIVVLVEGILLHKMIGKPFKRTLWISFVLNGTSWASGIVLMFLGVFD